jgi:hypothetical protein
MLYFPWNLVNLNRKSMFPRKIASDFNLLHDFYALIRIKYYCTLSFNFPSLIQNLITLTAKSD